MFRIVLEDLRVLHKRNEKIEKNNFANQDHYGC